MVGVGEAGVGRRKRGGGGIARGRDAHSSKGVSVTYLCRGAGLRVYKFQWEDRRTGLERNPTQIPSLSPNP